MATEQESHHRILNIGQSKQVRRVVIVQDRTVFTGQDSGHRAVQ